MQTPSVSHGPSAWVARHARLVPKPGPVLDLAAGSGRHSRLFLDLGYRVTALDRDVSRLAELGGADIIAADLEDGSPWPLKGRQFAGIVVTNYLFRPILPRIVAALSSGGVLIYETFGVGQERYGKPRNPEHLLRPGELLEFAEREGLAVRAYFCSTTEDPEPRVRQGVVAQRR
jgi:SAM-dependent methyltransferase